MKSPEELQVQMSTQELLTVIQWHLSLGSSSTGLQTVVVPRECRDEAGMIDGAQGPLLLTLRKIWPWKKQGVRECTANQNLCLQGTQRHPSEVKGQTKAGSQD